MYVIILIDGSTIKYHAPLTWARVEKIMTEKGFSRAMSGEYRYWWHEESNMHATVHKLDKLD